jgi:hypothetical protein
MLDSDVWRDLAAQFQKLAEKDPDGDVHYTWWCRTNDESPTRWTFGGAGRSLRVEFDVLGRRAGSHLGCPAEADLLGEWLKLLREIVPGAGEPTGEIRHPSNGIEEVWRTGCIGDICDASMNLCRLLEGRAIQKEHTELQAVRLPPEEMVQSGANQSKECTRSKAVDAFLQSCNQISSVRIRRKHIWGSIGHATARQFEYWQVCNNGKTTAEDNRNFSRIIAKSPEAFLDILRKQHLIGP